MFCYKHGAKDTAIITSKKHLTDIWLSLGMLESWLTLLINPTLHIHPGLVNLRFTLTQSHHWQRYKSRWQGHSPRPVQHIPVNLPHKNTQNYTVAAATSCFLMAGTLRNCYCIGTFCIAGYIAKTKPHTSKRTCLGCRLWRPAESYGSGPARILPTDCVSELNPKGFLQSWKVKNQSRTRQSGMTQSG